MAPVPEPTPACPPSSLHPGGPGAKPALLSSTGGCGDSGLPRGQCCWPRPLQLPTKHQGPVREAEAPLLAQSISGLNKNYNLYKTFSLNKHGFLKKMLQGDFFHRFFVQYNTFVEQKLHL